MTKYKKKIPTNPKLSLRLQQRVAHLLFNNTAETIMQLVTLICWTHKVTFALLQLWSRIFVQKPLQLPFRWNHLNRKHLRVLTLSQCCLHYASFTSTAHHKSNVCRWVDDREGKGNSLWGWFWRICDVSNPFLAFLEEWMTREQRGYMSIWTHSHKHEIKLWEPAQWRYIYHTSMNQMFETSFIIIRSTLRRQGIVDGINITRGYWYLQKIKEKKGLSG